ncbi:MAG: Histone deacetylase-like amidohydrolase [Acidimicrobiales bacterium]|nr:MAG: histone deacetylase [Actinomycetota bacterium]MBV6508355.1 Histone deacetylase-like amidohydrolase [Acidimicrobiales bacterium]RIK04826.1 MAG: hypothetical protein DCC48_12345 [Acidobacteriota bacterium]
MTILVYTDAAFGHHDAGLGHPERPERLLAVQAGEEASGVVDAVVHLTPPEAPSEALEAVHTSEYLVSLRRFCEEGGGRLDADTVAGPASWQAAAMAAGSGLDAVRQLRRGNGDAAFCAVRPPGHHAEPARAMGFCLLNNVAVAATSLVGSGERVVVFDYDAHHGNGTQDIFYQDPRVLFVSWHQFPLYPGTGAAHEVGEGSGLGTTVNLPLPAGATGDHYRQSIEEVVAPVVEEFEPTWMLVSLGFDAHRSDPLTHLGLTSGDYGDIAADLLSFAPPGRRVLFLEGGYDLQAITDCTAATLAALEGERLHPEQPSAGGPGEEIIPVVKGLRHRLVGDR